MRFFLATPLTLLIAVVLVQNRAPIDLQIGLWRGRLPAAVPLLAAYLAGGLTMRAVIDGLAARRGRRT